jgi:hypothetical protein
MEWPRARGRTTERRACLKQDLATGEGDVGAFEPHHRRRAFSDTASAAYQDMFNQAKSADSGLNAAVSCGWGSHGGLGIDR